MTLTLITIFWFTIRAAQAGLLIRDPVVNWASVVSSRGDHLPDFSYCGYRNSDSALPSLGNGDIVLALPKKTTDDIGPSLQQAINEAWQDGGGTVRIPAGKFYMTAGIQLYSNVIVRGTGQKDTTIVLKRKPTKPVFTLGRFGIAPKADFGYRSRITNSYVPVRASTVTVKDASGFVVGQTVYIARAVTESWVRTNGMSDLVKNGNHQEWIPVGTQIMAPNIIKTISGNTITFKIPLTDNLNSAYMRAEVRAYTPPEPTSEMGVANLQIEAGAETCSGTRLDYTTCNYAAVRFASWTVDSWASGLNLTGFNKFFEIQRDAARITIQDTIMNRNKDIEGTSLPSDMILRGSQVLIQDCTQVGLDTARSYTVSTDAFTPGPNAITRYETDSGAQKLEPFERWSHGLLAEDSSAPTKFGNRGTTGRGWAVNAGVGWNLRNDVTFESPPLGINWCIGCGSPGDSNGNATLIQSGHQVKPRSLFAAQLQARGVNWYDRGAD
ncbi:hypothetical protein N0V84_003820 [Fusarium piperis]|uniref:Pectate lyase superfamily protein domain-containing protein n=1 Tax=Fusarium piperis TaxID=1435070 RepID=A0A9W8WH13_9HYPO|nr:hypothetical protein N0V84_003820 [Fusarium piperis]